MPTSKFTLATGYPPRSGDFLCLPFLDETRPCYPRALLPKPAPKIAAPRKKGASRVVFAGREEGKVSSRAGRTIKVFRLDAE